MPIKTDFPVYPFLDPELDPNHPIHNMPPIEEDKFIPLGARERKQLEKAALERALEDYTPPHVRRSWETDHNRDTKRNQILRLVLPLSAPVNRFDHMADRHPNDSSVSKRLSRMLYDESSDLDHRDFRQFAYSKLRLGYNRFHASYGDPLWPSDEPDDIPPGEVCWIMEYTYRECNTIRRKLANFMGLFPDVIDPENPFYDPELAWRYDQRLRVRCRRKTQHCIRPSHIEVFTASGIALP